MGTIHSPSRSSPRSPPPTWLVPILFLQMLTILLFVVHEVFWDAGGIAPSARHAMFLPKLQHQHDRIVLGMVPPTPAPKGTATQRWLHHPNVHYSDIAQTLYDEIVPCHEATSPKIPTFVIAGTQKAGTSALYYLLKEHGGIESSIRFETHFFDNAIRKHQSTDGEAASNETICELFKEYRKEFPDSITEDTVTFEKVRYCVPDKRNLT